MKDETSQKVIQEQWDNAEKVEVEVKLPNPDKPEYPIITSEKRVTFKVLFNQVLPLAKEDGCVFIPYEETTEAARQKRAEEQIQGNIAADNDPMAMAAAAAEKSKD